MVGTAEYQVTSCSKTWPQNLLAENRGGITTVPPACRADNVEPNNPWTWNSGITTRLVSLGPSLYVLVMVWMEDMTLP